jgi:hypothetical protein
MDSADCKKGCGCIKEHCQLRRSRVSPVPRSHQGQTYENVQEKPFLPELAEIGLEDADVVRTEASGLVDGAEEVLNLERVEVERAVAWLDGMTPFRRDPRRVRVPSNRATV